VARRSVSRLAAAVLVLGLAACGEEVIQPPVAPPPATLAELTGPWRPTPLGLDPLLWARAEEACRKDMEMAPGTKAIIIDVRGAGVATLRMTGATRGSCNTLQLLPDGTFTGAGGGWNGPSGERLGPRPGADLGEVEQQAVGGGDLKVTGWSIYGTAGDEIASVVVEPRGHQAVLATLTNGWFSAWWPTLPGEPNPLDGGRGQLPVEPPIPQVIVRGYDASGVLLDELQP
jgi:hypothetical protein